MATSGSDAAREVAALNRSLSSAATEAARLARTTRKLEQSMEAASNGAIDKAAEALTELAKQSIILEDSVKDNIKANKQAPRELAKVIDRLEKQGDALIIAQKKYRETLKNVREQQALAIKAAAGSRAAERKAKADALRAERAATRALKDQLTSLGISAQNAAGNIDALAAEARNNKQAIQKVATDLSKPSAQLGKVFDLHKSKLQESITKYSKFGAVAGLATKALTSLYEQSIRLANRGLVGSMHQINLSAIKLRLSAEEFEAVISENRDIVNTMGGGAAGIEKFEEYLKSSSVGLEYLGKNAYDVITKYTKSFTNVGMGPYGPMSDAFKKLIPSLNKQFKLLHGAFGDTAEQFSAYYETVLSAETIQSKLNAGQTKEVSLQMQEIMARTTNLRLMGVTNKELEDMSRRVEATFNLKRNEQGEAMAQRIFARQGYRAAAQSVLADQKSTDSEKTKAQAVLDFIQSGQMERHQNMERSDKERFSDENRKLMQDMTDTVDSLARLKEQNGGRTSTKGIVAFDLLPKSGVEGDYYDTLGKTLKSAQNRTGLVNAGSKELETRATAAYANTLSDASGKTTLLGESFGLLRSTVEMVSAVLKNPFGTSLMAASAAAAWLATSLAGPAMIKSLGALAAVGGGGKLGMLKSLGGVGVAGAAGYAIGEAINAGIDAIGLRDLVTDKLGGGIAKALSYVPILGANASEAIALDKKSQGSNKASGVVTVSKPPRVAQHVTPSSVEDAIANAAQTVGVDRNFMMAMAAQESGFNPNAKAATSSASGLYQFIDGTWSDMVKKYGAQTGIGMNDRFDPSKNAMMGALFARDNKTRLESAGFSGSNANLYGAHFLGAGGAIDMLKAGGNAIAANVNPAAAAANRNVFYNKDGSPKTVDQLFQFFNDKVGSKAGVSPFSAAKSATLTTPQIPIPAESAVAALDASKAVAQKNAAAQASAAANQASTTSSTGPTGSVIGELQKHTSLLNVMVTLLGKTEASKRGYQMDQQTGLNVAT